MKGKVSFIPSSFLNIIRKEPIGDNCALIFVFKWIREHYGDTMKVQMKVGNVLLETAEVGGMKDAFEELSQMCTVFSPKRMKCGCCGGTDILPNVRTAQGYTFFEFRCQNANCRAKFGFGQVKEDPDILFPQLKDKEKNYLPNSGWEVYQKPPEEYQQPQQPAQSFPPQPAAPPAYVPPAAPQPIPPQSQQLAAPPQQPQQPAAPPPQGQQLETPW